MARAVHMQHAYAFRLYEGLQEGGYLITYLVVSISEMIIDYFPSARCFSTLFGQKGQEQLVMDCWTPKQSQLAVGKHFSWSSTSILEGSHCLSPPGGLHAERAAGVPVRQWKKKKNLCENNKEFLASVVGCAYWAKETSTTFPPWFLSPHYTTDLWHCPEQMSYCTHWEKSEVQLFFFRPQILKYLLAF